MKFKHRIFFKNKHFTGSFSDLFDTHFVIHIDELYSKYQPWKSRRFLIFSAPWKVNLFEILYSATLYHRKNHVEIRLLKFHHVRNGNWEI